MSEQPAEPVATPEPDPIPEVPVEPPVDPVPPVSLSPSPYVAKYAASLKGQLGENYSNKFDKMGVEARIDAMEATLDVLGKQTPTKAPLEKPAGQVPMGEQPPMDNKPKTFLQKQQAEGYGAKMDRAGSYATIAKNLYNK